MSYDDDVPNKTIYVADTDLPLFQRAQELTGDNLSATIVRAREICSSFCRSVNSISVSLFMVCSIPIARGKGAR